MVLRLGLFTVRYLINGYLGLSNLFNTCTSASSFENDRLKYCQTEHLNWNFPDND